jgi:hypothetical protein
MGHRGHLGQSERSPSCEKVRPCASRKGLIRNQPGRDDTGRDSHQESRGSCQPGSSVVGCRNRDEQDNEQSDPDGADVAEDQPCARQAVALLASRTDLP